MYESPPAIPTSHNGLNSYLTSLKKVFKYSFNLNHRKGNNFQNLIFVVNIVISESTLYLIKLIVKISRNSMRGSRGVWEVVQGEKSGTEEKFLFHFTLF